jgi:magnesium transporter
MHENQAAKKANDVTKLEDGEFLWIEATPTELHSALDKFQSLTGATIYKQHTSDCLNPNHSSYFDNMQKYNIMIFRALVKEKTFSTLETTPVVFMWSNNVLLTISDTSTSLKKIKTELTDPQRIHPAKIEGLIYSILNLLINSYLLLRDPLTEKFTEWQKLLLDERKPFKRWNEIFSYKTNIQKLYLICEQQLDAISSWQQSMTDKNEEINEVFDLHLSDLQDHVERVSRFAHQIEKQVDALQQLYYSLISNRTNTVMRLLTVISCIVLPLSFITGIFGMNFEKMPLIHNQFGFIFALVGMVVIAIALVMVFVWKRWI